MLIGIDGLQQFQPGTTAHAEVQEALHHVELLHGRAVCLQILTYLLCCLLRTLLGSLGLRPSLLTLVRAQASLALSSLIRSLDKGEHHECQVTLKLTSRLLQLQHLLCGVHAIEGLHGVACCLADQCFYIHFLRFLGAKVVQIERNTKFIWIFPRCSLHEVTPRSWTG